MEKLKVGDKVVMNGKYLEGRQGKNAGKVFTVRSTPYFVGGTTCVLLDGYRGAYAVDGLKKVDEESKGLPVQEMSEEERQEVEKDFQRFLKCVWMPQDERDEMFNSGVFNEIAMGYGKIAGEQLGLTGNSITALEEEMKKALDLYDAKYARKIYNRIG